MVSYEEYREQMHRYAEETSMMSCTQHQHPAYQAMHSMGRDLVPHLIHDLYDYSQVDDRHSHFIGEFDPWAAMVLLGQIVGDERPHCPEKIKGRIDPLVNLWIDWGKQHGYIFVPTIL